MQRKLAAKDQAGAAAEFKNLTQACAACHKVHKK
jgi:cytochrome c556